MPAERIVVIGGSSGALESLITLVRGLPHNFGAPVFVVFHVPASAPARLDRVLTRVCPLPVHYAVDGESIRPGEIYLAPPDRHLILKGDEVRVTHGPRENRFRPAIDPLFRTAAQEHGSRVIGIILSGGQWDGAAGLAEIKMHGGVALVQDPAECLVPTLPEAAINSTDVDHVLSKTDMASVISGLVGGTAPTRERPMNAKQDTAEAGGHDIHHSQDLGEPTPFTCPDCGGTVWMSQAGDLLTFRCHVGHRFNGDDFKTAQDDAVETALWTALRALEESAELRRRMARHAKVHGMASIAESYGAQALQSEQRAGVIRKVLMPESSRLEAVEVETVLKE
jgi:two-component system, chemotaxis family, protein-glutamate methylesterase/glutaminase